MVANLSHAQSGINNNDAILDEAFLLFLADSVENDTELLDPLSMIENTDLKTDKLTDTKNETQTDNKEANDE